MLLAPLPPFSSTTSSGTSFKTKVDVHHQATSHPTVTVTQRFVPSASSSLPHPQTNPMVVGDQEASATLPLTHQHGGLMSTTSTMTPIMSSMPVYQNPPPQLPPLSTSATTMVTEAVSSSMMPGANRDELIQTAAGIIHHGVSVRLCLSVCLSVCFCSCFCSYPHSCSCLVHLLFLFFLSDYILSCCCVIFTGKSRSTSISTLHESRGRG